jgi:uncharacterized SAM-binding protein YcdF (DUF218 family)
MLSKLVRPDLIGDGWVGWPRDYLKYLKCACLSFMVATLGMIPLKIAVTQYQVPQAQAILVLGGNPSREAFTAQFSQRHPNLPVWLSSGMEETEAIALFEQAGKTIPSIHVDRRAVDTVTNFTTLVGEFKQRGIRHLFLITSDYHIARAKLISSIVFGSNGIVLTPISVPSSRPAESPIKAGRDFLRSLIWLYTGWTGENFSQLKVYSDTH